MVANASIQGVIEAIIPHDPTNEFTSFDCPMLLTRNEDGGISVTITNPISDSLGYLVQITAADFRLDPPAGQRKITLEGGEAAAFHWKAVPVSTGMRNALS